MIKDYARHDQEALRLIVFTRYPEPGKTKTRLISALGQDGAAELHRKMVERTVSYAKQLQMMDGVSLEIRFDGGDEISMGKWLGAGLCFRPQGEGDLGERMNGAFVEAFDEGADKVVLVGTDCPGLTAHILREAFRALNRNALVLGPAMDGGYYLIGLHQSQPSLFKEISWSTARVLNQTVEIASKIGLAIGFVDTLEDVDRVEDVAVWQKWLRQ